MKVGLVLPLLALALMQPSLAAKTNRAPRDPLLANFQVPPAAARPRVWWHWMNGNISKDGIRRDLEWMKKIGIGGVDAIDASIDTPQVVDTRLVYMTPEWKDAFLYAVQTADKLGMEFSINSSPGWSETGGPWVTPEQAMKKAVWSKTVVVGPFHGVLPRPPGNIGPIQNAPFALDDTPTPGTAKLDFYRDALVIAYRQPMAAAPVDKVSSNAGSIDAALLSDGDLSKSVTLTPAGNDDVWVKIAFKRPETIQGLTLALTVPRGVGWNTHVEASDDGAAWRPVADMPKIAELHRLALIQQTMAFAPVKARYFRVVFTPAEALVNSYRPQVKPPGLITSTAAPPARSYKIAELVFHSDATIHEAEKKAQYATPPLDFYTADSPASFAPGTAIDPASVINLTGKMKADGTLDWTPPPGRWVVLRLGYSLSGKENHPATREATGLEVDKLNAADVRAYITTYLDSYSAITGPALFGKRGLNALTLDSSEVGMQNWTEDILSEFKASRGYDPVPFLPVLTGVAMKSPADSDRFLYDFRRTIAELYARNHYGVIAEVARERGLINYAESIENNRPGFGDDMEMRRYADIPMGAMWTYGETYPITMSYEADLLGAASVAHVYGRRLVAAESLTSQYRLWAEAPRDLKSTIDLEFARGVNRVVLHTSVHQPVDKPPGLTLFSYGQFFNRLSNWSSEAGPWITYIARASELLQQGRFAADVAYFYGEEAPIVALFAKSRVDDVPPGYAFDFVNLDVLLNQLSVDNGELVSKSGMRYRVLYLGGSSQRMTLAALRRIGELVRQGATLVGERPVSSPSLADDPAAWNAAADALFGTGKVYATLPEAFAALNLAPDFSASGTDANVLHLHRHLSDGDLYFLSSRSDQPQAFTASFRLTGKIPELWDAVSGKVSPASYRIADGRTEVSLSLPANGSVFVVFRKPAKAEARTVRSGDVDVAAITGPWTLAFQPDRGAPARITQPHLTSWSDNADPGVKYFSGTGTYTKTFTMPGKRKGAHYTIDLGQVRDIAEVTLNGKPLGTVWTTPYRLDVTKAIKPGKNLLTVKVVNLWVNRLIGDAQPDAARKYTFTTIPTYRPDAPLRPSGLLGPVLIKRAQ